MIEPYEALEYEFANWVYGEKAERGPLTVACSSGTAALHLALEALQLPLGSIVLVPNFTMIACARAVVLAGLRPVFVDCDPYHLTLDPDAVEETIHEVYGRSGLKASAILAVHVYGRSCPMGQLSMIARKYRIPIIEDLAEAHGLTPHPETTASCWSFYRNKIVAGEEGGAVSFRDPSVARIAHSLRSVGMTEAHDFLHRPRGHNYRLANSLASLIRSSLRDVSWNLDRRRQLAERWNEYCPREWRMPERDVNWVYDFRIPGLHLNQLDRIVKELGDLWSGFSVRHGFKPMTWQPEFAEKDENGDPVPPSNRGTNAEWAAQEVLYLSLDPSVSPSRDLVIRTFDTAQWVVDTTPPT